MGQTCLIHGEGSTPWHDMPNHTLLHPSQAHAGHPAPPLHIYTYTPDRPPAPPWSPPWPRPRGMGSPWPTPGPLAGMFSVGMVTLRSRWEKWARENPRPESLPGGGRLNRWVRLVVGPGGCQRRGVGAVGDDPHRVSVGGSPDETVERPAVVAVERVIDQRVQFVAPLREPVAVHHGE